jgi:thiamine biosynthesis protein ThiI
MDTTSETQAHSGADPLQFDYLIIHYGEIALKKGNRGQFQRTLSTNIKSKIGDALKEYKFEDGQITCRLSADADQNAVRAHVEKIPGIAYFSFASRLPVDLDELAKAALSAVADREFDTFRVLTKRRNKSHPFTSMDVDFAVGSAVKRATGKTVRLQGADCVVKIEITRHHAYLSVEDIPGTCGLPTERRQKVMCLLSGGLDSPVAAYQMMKRGCEVLFVHFQHPKLDWYPGESKIAKLCEQLAHFQIHSRLFVISTEGFQRAAMTCVPADMRMLVFRKFMVQTASLVARKHKAQFLITGDSMSQVASQTFDNLHAVYLNAPLPILTPLIGMDKQEIVNISRKIGTFDISNLEEADCCSYFVPAHPALRARSADINRYLEELDAETLVQEAVSGYQEMSW